MSRTNASGWAVFPYDLVGAYAFEIAYPSHPALIYVFEKSNAATYARVRLPSGNVSTVYVPS